MKRNRNRCSLMSCPGNGHLTGTGNLMSCQKGTRVLFRSSVWSQPIPVCNNDDFIVFHNSFVILLFLFLGTYTHEHLSAYKSLDGYNFFQVGPCSNSLLSRDTWFICLLLFKSKSHPVPACHTEAIWTEKGMLVCNEQIDPSTDSPTFEQLCLKADTCLFAASGPGKPGPCSP